MQTQIRLLLDEQSDQGLHCLRFPLHLLDTLLYGCSNFRMITASFSGVRSFRISTVIELPHEKAKKMIFAPSEDSDQPGRLPSLIRVFSVHSMSSLGPKVSSCR